jgi:hypothetical protein
LREICEREPFRKVLTDAGFSDPRDLPRGLIVCTAELVGCEEVCGYAIEPGGLGLRGAEYERDFGDYSPGRFAWLLDNIRPVPPGLKATGKLGLWEWDDDASFRELMYG